MKFCVREKCINYIIYLIVVNIVGKESIILLFVVMVYDCIRKKNNKVYFRNRRIFVLVNYLLNNLG